MTFSEKPVGIFPDHAEPIPFADLGAQGIAEHLLRSR
jgi:hypothetical protein